MNKENKTTNKDKAMQYEPVLAPVVCYLCGYKFKEGDKQLDMYGELVCQGCWDWEMAEMFNMH